MCLSRFQKMKKYMILKPANATPTNHVTVGRYIKYLCNAFVFYDVKRYDIRGKRYLENSEKFYLCDSGIRYDAYPKWIIAHTRHPRYTPM